ncbi:MAG TPA: hypothetical protein VHZ95_21800, partial [Polyangiales bacterium]|nr:hypothetical protein [Polyangiales bacterium]
MNRIDLLIGGLFCVVISGTAASSGAQPFPTPANPPPPSAAATAPAPATPAAPATSPSSEPVDMGTFAAPPIATPSTPPPPPPLFGCQPGFSEVAGRCVESCKVAGAHCAIEHAPGFRRHDGLMVRETSGIFSTSLRAHSNDRRSDLKDQTVTGNLTVDVGAAVIDNLIVRGRIEGALGGFKDSPFGPGHTAALFGMLGAGADYYFMPINLYVGGTLGVAGVTIAEINDLDKPK